MNPIIALWAHPRARSTVFERIMMERGDLQVLHEPFSYLYYVHEPKAHLAQEYVDPEHPTTYAGIRDHICSLAEQSPVFFKDMAVNCFAQLCADESFLQRLTHTFLIREPRQSIASYYALLPQVTLDEIGYEQLHGIFARVMTSTGRTPPVVNADDLIDDPHGLVAAYCQALGLPFMPESLQWEAGQRPEWDIWTRWHVDAANSTGIENVPKAFDDTVENNELLHSYYDHHLPFYTFMNQHRIVPGRS